MMSYIERDLRIYLDIILKSYLLDLTNREHRERLVHRLLGYLDGGDHDVANESVRWELLRLRRKIFDI
jgi:hypothetical protein